MKRVCDATFELQPVFRSTLPDVAAFLHRWRNSEATGSSSKKFAQESIGNIERRLKWLLIDNPVARADSLLGFAVCDDSGTTRGLVLCSPAAFVCGDKQLLGLCCGTFLVERQARSMGFYLFKKCLKTPGYSFHFACSCNSYSSEIWKAMGAPPVPNSQTEYILPIRLDKVVAAYVGCKTPNRVAARIARMCGRTANPILRLFTPGSAKLELEPCSDWEKLSELFRRHRGQEHITSDRSPALLQWRYGPASPSYPCSIYLFRDSLGDEGWFALGHLVRGQGCQFRASVLLDAIWPRDKMSYGDVLELILRVSAATTDAVSFRWQPGLDYSRYRHRVIPRRLAAPLAFVSVPKGEPCFPLELFDYDDSELMAWTFEWRYE
jgi:hypothetical protein